jgi:hypothetical protein
MMSKRCEDTVSIRVERDSETFRILSELKESDKLSFRKLTMLAIKDYYDKLKPKALPNLDIVVMDYLELEGVVVKPGVVSTENVPVQPMASRELLHRRMGLNTAPVMKHDNESPGQRIVCAANRYSNGRIILGARHFDQFMVMQLEAEPTTNWKALGHEQGFVCNRYKFHTREEALKIAKEAGQIMRRCGNDEDELFNENLY